MKKIDESQVRHVAGLARLKLTDVEIAAMAIQLGDVLEYVGQLQRVNTDGAEPTAHPLDISNVLAADEPIAPLSVEAALANAPEKAPPFFKVPKVLEQESP